MKNIKWIAGALLLTCAVGFTACGQPKDPVRYKVTFTQEGCEDVVRYVNEGESLASSNIPTPKSVTGYTVAWEMVDFSSISADLVVEAVATPNQYTVTYQLSEDLEESFVGEASLTQTITYDSQYTLSEAQRYGYTFVGWQNGQSVIPQSGVWKTASDVTVTAAWAENFYTVTFAHADGSVDTVVKEKGDVITEDDIPACKPMTGYTVAWETVDFATVNENTTVSAVKTASEYTVTYNLAADESVEGDTTETVVFGNSYTLKTPQRQGYTFRYWKLADGTALNISGEWSLARNVELTAEWTANTNLITFIQADGEVIEREVRTGETLTDIPVCKQVTGYDVVWSVTDFSSVTGAMTVTAVKTAQTYTVTYSVGDDVTVGDTDTAVVYNAAYQLETATRYGYTLSGWKTEDGVTLALKGTWTLVGNQTLTPVWAENFYTVTFVHADNTQVTRIVENGDVLTDIPATQTVKGHTVVWSVTDFSNVSSNITVNSIVTANGYTYTYRLENGESVNGETTVSVAYGTAYQLAIPENTDSSKVFVAWVDASTGKTVPLKGVWTYETSLTLVATWQEDEEANWTGNY